MRLVLNPDEDAAHGDWLRQTPGGYEWWYFDALSDDGAWAFACIWFLGNPFSPYYRLSAQGKHADPYAHNAFFFALYHHGRLHAYHFTRFPRDKVTASETLPATLTFGPNSLRFANGAYALHLTDDNANRRILIADLQFVASPLLPQSDVHDAGTETHFWLPAAPACRVEGAISLGERLNPGLEEINFHGHGYHDHNWGVLPFVADIRDWYWARVSLGDDAALILYYVRRRGSLPPVSHLLRFDKGQMTFHETDVRIRPHRTRINGFGTPCATRIDVSSKHIHAEFRLGVRLDSAPFYLRTLCKASLITDGRGAEHGTGLAEYFRPRMLAWPLVASATKSRIVNF